MTPKRTPTPSNTQVTPHSPTTKYSSLTTSQTRNNFGLIPRSYPEASPDSSKTQWQLFTTHLQHLIATAPSGTTYKLFYCARHGEGDHNVAEALYGTKAWDDYWSKLDGDGTRYWVDAHLTAVGEQQARDAGAFFARQFKDEKMPVPDAWVASPLMRCLQTADLEWTGSEVKGVRPTIKEMAREVMGEHTCDRRSSRTKIHAAQPEWPIEEGFAEEDELWQANHRETYAEHDVRTLRLLEQVFANEGKDASVLSLTSHSGAIASLMRVIGHREFRLATGGMVPILIKVTKLK
jgi:broad specificity phosphatase PhoE